ncbi:glycosyltransferase family 2 protein [Oerskovia sp. NPDC056781]|uniref:glycosyltransferase family 2 protein n=1 Tax=Oerskovia sp. NPDC056781 TaxID=3345942 RepID=UPI003670E827
MSATSRVDALPLTVVIPVKDDARHLERCLEAIARQTRSPHEVVVVDNASTDDSADVARRAGARLVVEPSPGIPAAASTGYDAVASGVIVRCDADTVPPPDWLERVHEAFAADPGLTALTGSGRFYDLPGLRARLAQLFYMRCYYWGTHAASGNVPLWGSNMAIRVDAWREVRHLVHRDDPHVHDDTDLSLQLGSEARVRYDGRLVVGVSGRTFESRQALARRFRWAWHTLAVNWAVSPPWERWAARITVRRRAGRDRTSPTAP